MRGPERVLALAAMLTVAEWLRGHLLSGFPWNAFGYALTEPLALAQSVSLIGIWGLTFLSVAIFSTPAVLADDKADTPHPLRPLLIGVMVLAGLTGYGATRLSTHPTELRQRREAAHHAAQSAAGREIQLCRQGADHGALSALSDRATGPQSKGVRDITHLIWPESAFPFFLTREPDALAQIVAMLKPRTELITGAVRAAPSSSAGQYPRL